MRLRAVVLSVAILLAAAGVFAIVDLSQAQGVLNLAGYTWSN